MEIENRFREHVANILKELKFEFHKRPDKLRIPIKDENKIKAFLRPISSNLGRDYEKYLSLLSDWREVHWNAYPTVFKVTKEGTTRWMKGQLVDREDRILFMIVTLDDQPIGHLGLSNFDFSKQDAEIDNVVRGIPNVFPGIMTLALNTLINLSFTKLGLHRLYLRVFFDNERAIKFYENCGFKGIRKIPLHKIVDGNITKYEEILEGEDLSIDRFFFLMEQLNK